MRPFRLKYMRVLRYDRKQGKTVKLYRDSNGNLWFGYSRWSVKLYYKNRTR